VGVATGVLERLRERPRHVVLAAFVAGLLATPLPTRVLPALACGAAALAGRRGLALAAACAALAGAGVGHARLAALDRTALPARFGTTVTARVALLEPPRPVRYGSLALVQLRAWESPAAPASVGKKGVGATQPAAGPRAATPPAADTRGLGERVLLRIPARLLPPYAPVGALLLVRGHLRALGPYESYEARRGAHAVLSAEALAPTGATRGGPWRLVDTIRVRAQAALATGLPRAQAALLRGMVLGDDSQLTLATRADFRTSGLSHLMAASGQNVALLTAFALALLSWLGTGLRARQLGVLALIALYVPLAGGGPSIQRAGVMAAASTIAALASRPASRWYALLLAAAVTLVLNPRASGDPGWQLSFAAVLAIVLLAPPIRRRLLARRLPEGAAEALAVTLAATLGTAPLIALDFGQLSLVSLPANLLAAPAVAPIVWLGTGAAALGQLAPALALPLDVLNACLLGYVGWVAHAAAGLPHAQLALG
jgi:competence protein ComEC